jgi:hypothetical protein
MSNDIILDVLAKLPNGRGTGAFGDSRELWYQLLLGKDNLSENKKELSKNFCHWIRAGIRGYLPDEFYNNTSMGSLVAIPKNGAKTIMEIDGVAQVRPICMASTLSKVISNTLLRVVDTRIKDILPVLQKGVGVSGGTEILYHGHAAALESNPNHVLLLLDSGNAYNSIPHSVIMDAIIEYTPHLLPFVTKFLNDKGIRMYFNRTSRDEDETTRKILFALLILGVPQGLPLSPLLYCLGIHKTLCKIYDETFKNVPEDQRTGFIGAYIDDLTVTLPVSMVNKFVEIAKKHFDDIGLPLNISKCSLLVRPCTQELLDAAATGDKEAISKLGPCITSSTCDSTSSSNNTNNSNNNNNNNDNTTTTTNNNNTNILAIASGHLESRIRWFAGPGQST